MQPQRYEERVQISQTQSIWQPIQCSSVQVTQEGDLKMEITVALADGGKPITAVRTLPKQLWRRVG